MLILLPHVLGCLIVQAIFNKEMHMQKQIYFNVSIIIFMFLVGMYLVPIACMNLDLSFMPGDMIDNRLNNYFLEHGFKWLSGQQKSFWDAPFFYPAPQVMTLSDNHLGILPIYSLFRFIKVDKETSYQLCMLVLYSLNYFSALYVLYKMKYNVAGASIGAYFFAFSLPISQYFGHEQFLSRFIIPFAIYYTLKFANEGNIKSYLIVCLSVVYQYYCSIYMGYFLSLCVIVVMLISMSVGFSENAIINVLFGKPKAIFMKAVVTLTSMFLLLPLMYPYYLRSKISKKNPWELIADSLPRIKSYLLPVESSRPWSWLLTISDTSSLSAGHLFIGLLPILALIAFPIYYFRYREALSRKAELVVFISIILITLVTLNINGFSFYKLLYLLPTVSSIRCVSRIVLMELFLISIIIASIVTLIGNKLRNISESINSIVLFIIIVMFVADQSIVSADIRHYSKIESQERYNKVVNRILAKNPSPKVYVYLPEDSKDNPVVDTLDAMLAAQQLNIATINGYSGYWPKDYHVNINRHDVCSGLITWVGKSRHDNGNNSINESLDNLIVIGGESCMPNGRLPSYSFYDGQLPNEALKADIRLPNGNIFVRRDSPAFLIPINIQNISSLKWPASVIQVAFRWLAGNGNPIGEYSAQHSLYYDLDPGEIMPFELQLSPPRAAGKYLLEIDLYQKNVSLFHEKGSKVTLANVIVE
jgi:hypothetical protein